MGVLGRVRDITSGKRPSRKFTVVDSDLTMNAPAFTVDIKYVSDDHLQKIARPYRNKKGELSSESSEQRKFRKAFFTETITDWSGLTKENLKRICPVFLEDPSLLADVGSEEIPFNQDDLEVIAENIGGTHFNEIVTACLDMEEYAREQIAQEKKESKSS